MPLPRNWKRRRELILQSIEDLLLASRQSVEMAGSSFEFCNATTRRVRLELTKSAMAQGRIVEALQLALFPEIMRKSPRFAIQLGHRVKEAGYYELALQCYATALYHAKHEEGCEEAVFNLAHCAKIAGHYRLAVECFSAFGSDTSPTSRFANEGQREMEAAIIYLTTSFTVGRSPARKIFARRQPSDRAKNN